MLKLAAGQLAVLAGLLALVDAALWLIAPISFTQQQVRFTQDLPGLKPSIRFTSFASGFRSLTLTDLKKPANSLRVLCLGASTTNQASQEIEDTWCALLEQRLKASHPAWAGAFHTLSFGKGGKRAFDTLLWLNQRIDQVKPDVVITLLGINDLSWAGGPGWRARDIDAEIARQRKASQKESSGHKTVCLRVSQLCRRVAVVVAGWQTSKSLDQKSLDQSGQIDWHSSNLPRLKADYRALPAVDAPTREPDPITEFEAATGRLLALLRERAIATIVLGQPVLWKPEFSRPEFEALWFPVNTPKGFVRPPGRWLLAEMQRYNRRQQDLAQRHGATFVELDPGIPKSLDYYFDDCHFTDKGSHAVAGLVLPALERVLQSAIAAGVPRQKQSRN